MTNSGNGSALSPDQKRSLLAELLRKKREGGAEAPSGPLTYPFPAEFTEAKEQYAQLRTLIGGDIYFEACDGINDNLVRINGREFINFTSYNYLGLSGHPVVTAAAKEAIDTYGTSVSASRLASGERLPHRELEEGLAKLVGAESALVFVSGYGTNEAVIGHLFGEGDLIVYDSLIHASVQSGCKLSGATLRPYPHNNVDALETILESERDHFKNVLVVTEGVFSMDGDIPDLPRMVEVKKKHRAFLMVDEAHSIGVLGATGGGIGEHHGVDGGDVDLWMGTLSKTFASCGGYIAAKADMIEYLKFTVPDFVYSAGISPPNTAAALASLRILNREPERLADLRERSAFFVKLCKEAGLDTGQSKDSAVVPIILGKSIPCVMLFKALHERGVYALPIMHPTVPENAARLRFFLCNKHTEEQLRYTVQSMTESLLRIESE